MPAPSVPGAFADPADVRRYAEAIVVDCLRIEDGDLLLVDAGLGDRELVVALAEACYAAGASIDVEYDDPLLHRARVEHAPEAALGAVSRWRQRRLRQGLDRRTAFLWIGSEELPGYLDGVSAERASADRNGISRKIGWWLRAHGDGRARWCIANWPTPGWAARVYPGLDADAARRRLFGDLLAFGRVAPDDPPGAWAEHLRTLRERCARLNERGLRRLRFDGPGTDLTVELPDGHRWVSGVMRTIHGVDVAVNFPTEEVFTTPHSGRSEGRFACTKPLSFDGRMIEGLCGELRGGRLVRLEADRDADRDALSKVLDIDPGGRRIGEVALVGEDSRIARTGRVYWSTGLDENVAAHVAFGAGFPFCRRDDAPPAARRSVNRSDAHVDVMIGGPDVDVSATDAHGQDLPLLQGGAWAI
jgi:aminopeptidase